MIVYPKREILEGKVRLALYDKDNNILADSGFTEEDKIIAMEYDGLVYTSFPQLPGHCFLDYASVVKKFKG